MNLQASTPGTRQVGHFNVTGTGIAQLQDLGGQVYNVKNAYPNVAGCATTPGAKADGTDDAPRVACAIAAAQAGGGGTIYFPAGTYTLQSSITVGGTGTCSPTPCNVIQQLFLRGAGGLATTLRFSGTNVNGVDFGRSSSSITDYSMGMTDLSIDAAGQTASTFAVRCRHCQSFSLQNIEINAPGIGIDLESTTVAFI